MFQFATCERKRALEFINQYYSACTDMEDSIKDILNLISDDIIRVLDPTMHSSCQIVPGKNFDEKHRETRTHLCKKHFVKNKKSEK